MSDSINIPKMTCSCPSNHCSEGVKVPRSSLQNTLKYGEGIEDVWVFTPEFLANQAAAYKASAIHAMDNTATAGAAAERIWEKGSVYGKPPFNWTQAAATAAANEAAEKACAHKAEWNLKGGHIGNFSRATVYASQMFEELVYLERRDEILNEID